MTLFFMLQLTLVLDYIISLSFSGSITNLLMFSVAFLLIFSFTLFFRYFLTLLLWNRLSLWYLNSMALLFILSGALLIIGGHFMWHLNSVTFLSGFIPALFFPYCSTGRNTAVRATNQKQEYQYLHSYQCG